MRKLLVRPGVTPAVILIAILIVAIVGAGFWYWGVYRPGLNDNVNYAPVANAHQTDNNAAAGDEIDTSDWQIFRNATYNYTFKFPTDWYYQPDAMTGPPPPALVFFSNAPDLTVLPYASFQILASDKMDYTLDTWGEVVNLQADGYAKTDTIVDGEPAVRLERHAHPSDTGATIYVIRGDWMYRFITGATEVATANAHEATMETMLASFEFTDPLVTDFDQTGIISQPDGGTARYLVWETPGNPANSAQLVFDHQYVPSVCSIDGVEQRCADALADGEIVAGDQATISGVTLDNGQVMVLKLIKLI